MEDSSISDKVFVERLCSEDADKTSNPSEITYPITPNRSPVQRRSDFINSSDLNTWSSKEQFQREKSEITSPISPKQSPVLSLKRSSDLIKPSDLNSLNLSTMNEQEQEQLQGKVYKRDVPLHEMSDRASILSLKRSSDFINDLEVTIMDDSSIYDEIIVQSPTALERSTGDIPVLSLRRSSDLINPSDWNTWSSKETLERKISEESDDVPLGIRLYTLQ